MLQFNNIPVTAEILKFISEIDEFKGRWQATQNLAPDRLVNLKRIATIESVGSSTRIEGAKFTDKQVEKLISNREKKSFTTAMSRRWQAMPTRWIWFLRITPRWC